MTDPVDDQSASDVGELWVIVVAGGSGRRYGGLKQFEVLVGSERVIDRSVAVAASVADGVVVVVPPECVTNERERWSPQPDLSATTVHLVGGGESRADSVRAGLARVPDSADVICVHDAARPAASAELYRRVVAAIAAGADGVVPAIPVVDTIKVVDGSGLVVDTPNRDSLVAVQTPQGFRADVLRRAHATGSDGSDDAVLVEQVGGVVKAVAGETTNLKITDAGDIEIVRGHLADRRA